MMRNGTNNNEKTLTDKELLEVRELLSEKLYRLISKVCTLSNDNLITNLKNNTDFLDTVNLIARLQKESHDETL